MERRIDVGVLGATGMVGQQFVVQLAGHPWFRLSWLGASERSAGQRYGDAAPWRLPTPAAARHRRPRRPDGRARQRARAGVLGDGCVGRGRNRAGVREGRPPGGQQLAQSPARRRRAAAHPRGERRSPRAHRGAAEGARVERRDHHQPELLDGGALARARAAPRRSGCARSSSRPCRRSPAPGTRRRVARRGGQRHPVHRRRGGEDRDRDEEDPRPPRLGRRRAAPRRRQRADHARAGRQRPHRVDRGGARHEAVDRRGARGATSFSGPPQRHGLPSAPLQPVVYLRSRTARSRGSTWTGTAA